MDTRIGSENKRRNKTSHEVSQKNGIRARMHGWGWHGTHLSMIPTVHCQTLDKTGIDSQPTVFPTALQTHSYTVADAGPGGVGLAAVNAPSIARERLEEGEAGGWKGTGSVAGVVSK